MSAYGQIGPYCRLWPTRRHTPLPRSRSVVVEVTKVVDIDRPEVVIVDHVKLVVAVLPRGTTQTEATDSVPTRTRSHPRDRHAGKVRRRRTGRRRSTPSIT